MPIKLGLVEDNDLLRNGYIEFFDISPEFEVVFAVADWKSLYHTKTEAQPDIILLDILLPSGNSIKSIHKIKQVFPYAHIVMLSALSDSDSAQAAFSNGAEGFLIKTSSIDFIKDALLQTHKAGGTPLSPLIATHLIDFKGRHEIAEIVPALTKRELDICKLAVTGMSNKMIASAMDISFFTVNQHFKHIYKKLNINSRSELIAHVLNG